MLFKIVCDWSSAAVPVFRMGGFISNLIARASNGQRGRLTLREPRRIPISHVKKKHDDTTQQRNRQAYSQAAKAAGERADQPGYGSSSEAGKGEHHRANRRGHFSEPV